MSDNDVHALFVESALRFEIADLRAALEHVLRVANESRTQTLRLQWIARRCRSALAGDDEWKRARKPRTDSISKQIQRMQERIEQLERLEDEMNGKA